MLRGQKALITVGLSTALLLGMFSEGSLGQPGGKDQTQPVVHKNPVRTALDHLLAGNQITATTYNERLSEYEAARSATRSLTGLRQRELRSVIAIVDGIAARGLLTASRINPLWLMLQANVTWWQQGPIPRSRERVSFDQSQLIFQYIPGQGLQFHALANFGKLNGLWMSQNNRALRHMVDEILPLAAERAGGIAWEYYFTHDGGRPPWVSGMAQATALQALARAAKRLNRADILPIAQQGLGIFQTPPPLGVNVKTPFGSHYLLYSFLPRLYVINGEAQAVVGLYDFATITQDQTAADLFHRGDQQAKHELPSFDTGAWSLYSRGSVTHESDLSYHQLLTGFLDGLCSRTTQSVYCKTSENFRAYLKQSPRIKIPQQQLQANKQARLRFRLSKISQVRATIKFEGKQVFSRSLGTLGHGMRNFGWGKPKRPGEYELTVSAVDLAGNRGQAKAKIRVKRQHK